MIVPVRPLVPPSGMAAAFAISHVGSKGFEFSQFPVECVPEARESGQASRDDLAGKAFVKAAKMQALRRLAHQPPSSIRVFGDDRLVEAPETEVRRPRGTEEPAMLFIAHAAGELVRLIAFGSLTALLRLMASRAFHVPGLPSSHLRISCGSSRPRFGSYVRSPARAAGPNQRNRRTTSTSSPG